jgi:hypothetical protein
MEFSEAQTPWRTVPEWVDFLVLLGFLSLGRPEGSRRITVVSMPCDSAGAGLVALGAIRKGLELPGVNDANMYYAYLMDLAKSNTNHTHRLRNPNWPGLFEFDGLDAGSTLWVRQVNSKSRRRLSIPPSSALSWHIAGTPPVVLRKGDQIPFASLYSRLLPGAGTIIDHNLSESNAQVCLAARITGGETTRRVMQEIRFRHDATEADLSQLLTIHRWTPNSASRVVLYNSRTDEFDRWLGRPRLVIADGDMSFRRVADSLPDSDVVGVVHRAQERDRLEDLGSYLQGLRQWYDQAAVDGLPQLPRGVGVAVLDRRRQCG